MAHEKIRYSLKDQSSAFELGNLDFRIQWASAWSIFGAWAIPSFLFVYWIEVHQPGNEYYKNAIDQAIGPNLLNVVGSFGIFLFGVSLVFSNIEFIAKVTNRVLISTYSIGALTFGILTGQWLFVVDRSELIWWKVGLFDITYALLLVIFFALNFLIWYLSFLLKTDTGNKSIPFSKFKNMNIFWKVSIGIGIIILITYHFLTQE